MLEWNCQSALSNFYHDIIALSFFSSFPLLRLHHYITTILQRSLLHYFPFLLYFHDLIFIAILVQTFPIILAFLATSPQTIIIIPAFINALLHFFLFQNFQVNWTTIFSMNNKNNTHIPLVPKFLEIKRRYLNSTKVAQPPLNIFVEGKELTKLVIISSQVFPTRKNI